MDLLGFGRAELEKRTHERVVHCPAHERGALGPQRNYQAGQRQQPAGPALQHVDSCECGRSRKADWRTTGWSSDGGGRWTVLHASGYWMALDSPSTGLVCVAIDFEYERLIRMREVAAEAAGGCSHMIELTLVLGSFKTHSRGANSRRSDSGRGKRLA